MSKRFHASPKGMLAVLACLALLCSLFAFSLTVLADPAGDYTPSRYLKLSSTTVCRFRRINIRSRMALIPFP